MSAFAPTGPSSIVQLQGNQQQRVELPDIEGDVPALRIVSTTHPSSTAYAYLALGDASIEVTMQSGMALDVSARREQVIALKDAPSHAALVMSVTTGAYTVCITPGVLVG
jgi:hypothetical protein